ncbi:MAG: ABC transporter ATP-binding protein [Anaerolineae bacterium]
MSQLSVERLRKHFGGLAALNNVSMAVNAGERRAIIGPNGAGKTTFFNLIAGELPPTSGSVFFEARDITRLTVYERANLGLGHTFQQNNLFAGLRVVENVRLAVQHRLGVAGNLFKPALQFTDVTRQADRVLEQVGLLNYRDNQVSTLAYGQQRALEIALALATEPKVLLLDEPTAGMSPAETLEMTQLIEALPRSLTMLIVEHDMDVVFSLADHITVLHYGQIIAQGTPDEVRASPMVQEIYLGISNDETRQ